MKGVLTLSFAALTGIYHATVPGVDAFEGRGEEGVKMETEKNQGHEASTPALTPAEAQKILYGK